MRPAERDDARGQAGVVEEQGTDGSGAIVQQLDATRAAKADERNKRRATLAAQLALKGFELRQLESGAWLISKWGLAREVDGPGLEGVEAFGRQVGAMS